MLCMKLFSANQYSTLAVPDPTCLILSLEKMNKQKIFRLIIFPDIKSFFMLHSLIYLKHFTNSQRNSARISTKINTYTNILKNTAESRAFILHAYLKYSVKNEILLILCIHFGGGLCRYVNVTKRVEIRSSRKREG
jgi:hypothetical protein